MTLRDQALAFATTAHADQVRNYTGVPYITHPLGVAEIVAGRPHSEAMVAAALLHDVVEDCGIPLEQIYAEFGDDVATLVGWVTDVSTPADGNRATRKALDLAHLAKAPPEAQTIKLADIIDNTATIAEHDPSFWKTYRIEKAALLDVLWGGDKVLWAVAASQCELAA